MSEKQKTTSWSWAIPPEEMKEQVEKYDSLKITESYRGVSVVIISALLLLTLVLSYFGFFSSVEEMLFSLMIYIPILFFVYKGHRWAMILLFALWTFEKVYTAYYSLQNGGGVFSSIIWWLIVAPYIYKALKVENERRKVTPNVQPSSIYCSKCGTGHGKDSKFCTKCGTPLIISQY